LSEGRDDDRVASFIVHEKIAGGVNGGVGEEEWDASVGPAWERVVAVWTQV